MTIDPIIDELHQQRAEAMERFHFDFEAFFRHLKEEERLSGKPLVSPARLFVVDSWLLDGWHPTPAPVERIVAVRCGADGGICKCCVRRVSQAARAPSTNVTPAATSETSLDAFNALQRF